MIQEARDASKARASLMVHFDLTERQADAVLAMPLRRLTGLEQESLRKEAKDLGQERERLTLLLENREQLLDALIEELIQLKKRFATPRRTKLVEGGDHLLAERAASQRPNAELQRRQALDALPSDSRLLIQDDGQVKIVSPQLLGRLHLNDPVSMGDEPSPALISLPINPPPRLLAVTLSGRVALVRWEFAGQQQGTLERFLPTALEGDEVVSLLPLPNPDDFSANETKSLGLLTSDGRFKRLPLKDIQELSGRAATVLKLKEGVSLKAALICKNGEDVAVISDIGRILRLQSEEKNLPLMGKLAQGPIAMRLLPGEQLVTAVSGNTKGSTIILLASQTGRLHCLELNSIRSCNRGDFGEIGWNLNSESTNGTERIAAACVANSLIGVVTSNGRHGRIDSNENNQIILKDNESILRLIPLIS
jgi:DNA gyrase subunit A